MKKNLLLVAAAVIVALIQGCAIEPENDWLNKEYCWLESPAQVEPWILANITYEAPTTRAASEVPTTWKRGIKTNYLGVGCEEDMAMLYLDIMNDLFGTEGTMVAGTINGRGTAWAFVDGLDFGWQAGAIASQSYTLFEARAASY